VCACPLPTVTTHPSIRAIKLSTSNYNLSLNCKADGATSYNWERQSGSIPSGAIGVNTNTLTIINLQPEDAGSYRCVATNCNGRSNSQYARVNVIGKMEVYSLHSLSQEGSYLSLHDFVFKYSKTSSGYSIAIIKKY